MYCVHCGKEISEEAVICPCCGKIVNEKKIAEVVSQQGNQIGIVNEKKLTLTDTEPERGKPTTLAIVAKVFMIIGCVFVTLYSASACAVAFESLWGFILGLYPLAWCLPMTLNYCSKVKNREEVSVAFKICALLFVNLIAGILMLCDRDN